MMAMAARDPFYLAVFEEELAANPGAAAAIEATCTPCHAPQGHFERREDGGRLGFADLTAGASVEAKLGRDGVACAFCHQIADRRLGEASSSPAATRSSTAAGSTVPTPGPTPSR